MLDLRLFEGLIDIKVIKIFSCFLKDKDQLFHLNMLSNTTKVPIATVMRIVQRLVDANLVQQLKIGKMKVYKLADSEKVKKIKCIVK